MIQDFADWLVYGVLEFTPHTRLGEAVNFFVYDTVKILFLLYAISLFMGVVNAYFPVERIRVFLTTKKLYGFQYFFAALFGAVTPFCSCSSIPPVYRLCERRDSAGRDVCLPDHIASGE